MKVLQVIDRLNIGGAERVMLNIVQLLTSRHIETGVLLFNDGFPLDKEINSSARIFVLKRKNKFSPSKLYHAHRICSWYDIVHVHMRHCYTYIRLAQRLFGGKYKVILHDHFGDIEINKMVPAGFDSYFKPKYYIGVSNTLVNWALETLKTNPVHTYLLSNIIIPRNGKVYRQPDKPQNRLFVVSNIRETKNIEFAIKLFKKLEWNSIIYGNKEKDAYFEKIEGLIAGDSKIRIVQGKIDLVDEYNKQDIAIHCGVSETGPLVLLEYLAYGVPFLAYNTGGVANKISGELPLHFIDNFEEEEWLLRITKILNQEGTPGKFQEVFKKHFSPDLYINECLAIYENILY